MRALVFVHFTDCEAKSFLNKRLLVFFIRNNINISKANRGCFYPIPYFVYCFNH